MVGGDDDEEGCGFGQLVLVFSFVRVCETHIVQLLRMQRGSSVPAHLERKRERGRGKSVSICVEPQEYKSRYKYTKSMTYTNVSISVEITLEVWQGCVSYAVGHAVLCCAHLLLESYPRRNVRCWNSANVESASLAFLGGHGVVCVLCLLVYVCMCTAGHH